MPRSSSKKVKTNPCSVPAYEVEWKGFLEAICQKRREFNGDRKQERSRRREQEILRAALRIFARDGISRSRIGDIASEAGMPASSIYVYYPSKEDLAYAVPHEHLSRFFQEYNDAVALVATFGERLRLYLWMAVDFARRNPEWARTFYLEIWPSVLVEENEVRHSIDDYARVIVEILKCGEMGGEWAPSGNVYEMATILIGSTNQLIIAWLLYRKPRDLMRATNSLLDRVTSLLLPAVGDATDNPSRRWAKVTA